jgi:hypothetical protein
MEKYNQWKHKESCLGETFLVPLRFFPDEKVYQSSKILCPENRGFIGFSLVIV